MFLLVGGNGGVVWAVQYIPSSLAALLVATVPLWMILFDAIRPAAKRQAQKPSRHLDRILRRGVADRLDGRSSDVGNLHGALAVLLASFLWAIGSIYGKTAELPASPLVTTGIEMLVGGAVQIFVAYIFGEFGRLDLARVSSRSASAWTYLTVIGPIAFVAYAWLLARRADSARSDLFLRQSAGRHHPWLLSRQRDHHAAHSARRGIDHRLGGARQQDASVDYKSAVFLISRGRTSALHLKPGIYPKE